MTADLNVICLLIVPIYEAGAEKEAFDKDGISIPYPHQVEIRKEA